MRAPTKSIILLVSILTLISFLTTNSEAQTSISGQQDIAALMRIAEINFDLEKEDAVILFDGRRVHYLIGGRLKTFVHRIVWINSAAVVRRYGDLRIPFDADRQTFTPITLRTWRDETWWESDTTGTVETLPFALRKCYDYSNMREMMMLHDGIELPCILEVAYTIEDKETFRQGAEGVHLFAGDDPTVWSWLFLGFPRGFKPSLYSSDGVQTTKTEFDNSFGLNIHTYKMEIIPPLPTPHTIDPAAYSEHVVWSTWKDWNAFGEDITETFQSAQELDDVLRDSLASIIDGSFALSEKAKRIAAFIDQTTRFINYPEEWWQWNPRAANTTYSTAYCHRWDRTVLAAVLFREAGFQVFPFFRGKGFGNITQTVPTLGRMDGISLWISGGNEVEAFYNPATSKIHNGLFPIFGRTVWIPSSGDNPQVSWSGEGMESRLALRVDMKYVDSDDRWTGTGLITAENGLNRHDLMEGIGDQMKNHLQSVLSGVIPNAEITDHNPLVFNRFNISAGFKFTATWKTEKTDGRHTMILGDPSYGIFDQLANDVILHQEERRSPVRLPGIMDQAIEIQLDLDGWDVSYHPETDTVLNEYGHSIVNAEAGDEKLIIKRNLKLTQTTCPALEWGKLRGILLADKNERNRTIILTKAK